MFFRVLIGIIIFPTLAFSQTVFPTVFPPLTNPSLDWGDIDSDGELDIFLMGTFSNSPFSNIYRYSATLGLYTASPDPIIPMRNGGVKYADLNLDGRTDIITTGESSPYVNQTIFYLNNGVGGFQIVHPGLPGFTHAQIAVADLEADGDIDILISGISQSQGPQTRIFINDGAGNYTSILPPRPKLFAYSIDWRDVDGDLDGDIIIAGHSDNYRDSVFIWEYDAGNFLVRHIPDVPQYSRASVKWVDYDADSTVDFIVCGSENGQLKSQFYSFNGISWVATGDSLLGLENGRIAYTDLDGNAYPDWLLSGDGPLGRTCQIWRGSSTGISLFSIPSVGMSEPDIAWGDFDGDNDADFFLSGEDSSGVYQTRVYRNDSLGFVRIH